jgi:periplasmic divalent cation tolerance protein
MDILSFSTTVDSMEVAQALARGLVERRLAACVQVDAGVQSHYRWEGRLCAEAEVRLTVKSLPALLPQLQAFLAEHHPYAVPQMLWQTMTAGPAYAQWLQGELAG